MEENKPIHNEEEVKRPKNSQDAVHEQQLNTPSTEEPIVPAAAKTPEAEQPITHTSQPVTEQDMEVHHHSHENHGKKNWKSYFWEFLMLFLAVFCGFLAENKREHMVEHQREKKFIRSLISNLWADINRLGTIIHLRNERAIMPDSFMLLLINQMLKNLAALFIFLILMLSVVWLFVLHQLMALSSN